MIETMNRASGVGIAGPQVGLALRVALLKLDYKTDNPYTVFVRNPVIVERSDETVDGYEGCLSIPGVGGLVRRNRWIRVEHVVADGEVVTTEAEDANAVLWQHELDHLDGVLYVDLLLGELLPMDEVRRLREELERGEQSRRFGDCLEGSILIVARGTRPQGLRRIAELLLG
jgi:peptide deformylase